MHGLSTLAVLNTEAVIRAILARAIERGLKLTRDDVLDELRFREDEDTTVWGATVDRLMGVTA